MPHTPRAITNLDTPAGKRIIYTPVERAVAVSLIIYLLLAFIVALWFIWDVFVERLSLVQWFGYEDFLSVQSLRSISILIMLGMGGGWLGGTLSAMRSLQFHYSATVEHTGNASEQEKKRFHIEWWPRWFWGPWFGAGLTLIVFALVRSGVLVFVSSPAQEGAAAVVDKFAVLGLGGLVGLGAKDVIEKLMQALKAWLRVEDVGVSGLAIYASAETVKYGGSIQFSVKPSIPVDWKIIPDDRETVGTITTNGLLRPVPTAPESVPDSLPIHVIATSQRDSNRSASIIVTLKKLL